MAVTGPSGAPLSTPARRSLANCRRLLAQRLNSLTVVTTSGDGLPNGGSLVAGDLAGGFDNDWYRGAWAYVYSGGATRALDGQLRRIGALALNVSDGTLAPSVPFTAQVPTGSIVELHKKLPPFDHDGWRGLRTCLNMALAECWTLRRIGVTGVDGQPSYDLSSYGDWLDPTAINELYGAPADASLNPLPWPGFHTALNGPTVGLEVGPNLPGGAAAMLEAYAPGDTVIRQAGAWNLSAGGFTADTDESLLQPQVLVEVALYYAYEALSTGGAEGVAYKALADAQRMKANAVKITNLPRADRRTTHQLGNSGWSSWGPADKW